ncbi:hypothetical protein [Methylophaga sp. UBA678]|uniref:hypothetical protein n=1 Tax=Methylophaga sp. UBA678 TaxID=1946901 RepID=UPI00259C77BB|nr:hypothetical protein [Methylophaga sp. UBA678]
MEETDKKVCGIIMPISSIDGCSESHWGDVLSILSEAISDAEYEPNLVSNSDDVGVIQKRIVQNLYENPIVVCDVSGKNPNVMFELGMRLAFDKPTIIVKDDKTSYSFDTSSIEHLEYRRDLRFSDIVEFKSKLKEKIIRTYKKATEDPEYTTFLKHFGEFKVAKIDTKEVSGQELIMDELRSMRRSINMLERGSVNRKRPSGDISVCLKRVDDIDMETIAPDILDIEGVNAISLRKVRDHNHLDVSTKGECDESLIRSTLADLLPEANIRISRLPRALKDL